MEEIFVEGESMKNSDIGKKLEDSHENEMLNEFIEMKKEE